MDGYFDIGEQKQYNRKTKALVKSTIRIRLASNVDVRDLPLLEYFVKVLGVGSLSTMSGKDRNQVRVIFSRPPSYSSCSPSLSLNFFFLESFHVYSMKGFKVRKSKRSERERGGDKRQRPQS